MPREPIAPHLRAFAPEFARRFAAIIGPLAALVAHAFLRQPRLVLLIVPLWRHLSRAIRNCNGLMATIAAGRRPRQAARKNVADDAKPRDDAGDADRAPQPRPHAPALPRSHAWLVRVLRHQAAAYGSQLAYLLDQPGVAELLAEAPASARFLRPLCRLLGIRRAAQPSAEASGPTQPCVPKAAGGAPSRPESAPAPAKPRATPPPPRWRPERPPSCLDPDLPWIDGFPVKLA